MSRAQLAALAISTAAVDAWVRRRRLHVVHRGVYAVGHTVLRREGRWLAAVLACGDGAVLSHVSAAVHWGLLQYDAPRPEVTAPASRKAVPGIRLHRSRSLDARDTTTHARGLVVETDGWETHRTRQAFEDDRRKDAALTAAGYRVMRFTWRELRDHPETVAARVTAGCSRAFASAPARAW